jgi:hypothetical protein
MQRRLVLSAALVLLVAATASAAETSAVKFQALKCPAAVAATDTWTVADRDGANRQVDPYLSSLGAGETGTGVIVSPSFRISTPTITFTICGHDGPQGKQNKNFIALVDVRKAQVLRQTPAPGGDAMKAESWNVADYRDREVRIEVRDGIAEGAFAWMGVGRIDAGEGLKVDFKNGLPKGWTTQSAPAAEPKTEVLAGAVPFERLVSDYSVVPAAKAQEIVCNFAAKRLYLLGCTVPGGVPGTQCGAIEIVYRGGDKETIPLILGFTLDASGKQISRSKITRLSPSADPFQHILAITPKADAIEKIVLRRDPKQEYAPRITAITCETDASAAKLKPLPAAANAEGRTQIQALAVSAASVKVDEIVPEVRRIHKVD